MQQPEKGTPFERSLAKTSNPNLNCLVQRPDHKFRNKIQWTASSVSDERLLPEVKV